MHSVLPPIPTSVTNVLRCSQFTLVSLMVLGLGWCWSVPEISVRKNTSNFVLESPFMVPPSVHTKEKRKKDCSHCML